LERVGVALDLDKLNGRDWYSWGAEFALATQNPDGTWTGSHGEGGADTCFALLFLKRANLTRDLSARMRGKLSGARELRAGGAGGAALTIGPKNSGNEEPPSPSAAAATKPTPGETRPRLPDPKRTAPTARITLPENLDPQVAGLARELLQTSGADQTATLERLRTGKGVMYTEALAAAIPQLGGEPKQKARSVLAERLTRMKTETLATYLSDEDIEIRRAAAMAAGMKDAKALIPELIKLLSDPESVVERAAHSALKALSGKDFGPSFDATRSERDQAIAKWKDWLSQQGRN
jgi:hypothetical protein